MTFDNNRKTPTSAKVQHWNSFEHGERKSVNPQEQRRKKERDIGVDPAKEYGYIGDTHAPVHSCICLCLQSKHTVLDAKSG